MAEHLATYSSIIGPEEYNRIMTDQHLYIAGSDQVVCTELSNRARNGSRGFTELGCGPARLLREVEKSLRTFPNTHLVGVDHDPVFLEHAREIMRMTKVRIVQLNLTSFDGEAPSDVFFSQGFHHHVQKGTPLQGHLRGVRNNLSPGGVYILSDEFLPEYKDEEERKIRAIIWYAHVIDHALKNNHAYLAKEEAKTLLDDLAEGDSEQGVKSQKQITLVLDGVNEINEAGVGERQRRANELLRKLRTIKNVQVSGDATVDLSRGDFKISEAVLREEMGKAGFSSVELIQAVGPFIEKGALAVYRITI